MKLLRKLWVLLTNGTAIYFMFHGTQQVALLNHLLEQDNLNRAIWANFALRISIPVLGILLELFGSRFATWANVGYMSLAGFMLCAIAAFNWSDFHGRLYLVFGVPALAAAAVTYLLYRTTGPRNVPVVSQTVSAGR